MRSVLIVVATGMIATVLGFAIGRFVERHRRWLTIAAVLAPFAAYCGFFFADDLPKEGTATGWFMTGLLFISPVLVPWMACLPLGYRMGKGSIPAATPPLA